MMRTLAQRLIGAVTPDKSRRPDERGRTRRQSVTRARVRRMYARPESFTDLLPWTDYLPDTQTFVLEDGTSVGACFELQPIATDGHSLAFLEEARDHIQDALTGAVPEDDHAPWVLQLYVQDERHFRGVLQGLTQRMDSVIANSAFTQHYLTTLGQHLDRVFRPQGLFEDSAVTGGRWRGRVRRVRAVIYRRGAEPRPARGAVGTSPVNELNDVCTRLTTALAAAGIRAQRGSGQTFYEWLLPWLNPCPDITQGDPDRLLEIMPYPGDDAWPFGPDFADSLMITPPRSDLATGTWWFDGLPHKCLTVQGLRRRPAPGHYTAERPIQDKTLALFDQMPEDTILMLAIIFQPQYQVLNHMARVVRAAIGEGAESALTRAAGEQAQQAIAQGDKVYPIVQAFMLRAPDLDSLHQRINALNTRLLAHGLQPITEENDLIALDSYVRCLPMNYEAALDKSRRRGRFAFARDIASLAPLYGRSTGTRHPGLVFFNRAGELLTFDPLSREDRKKNAHMLILGPTGSGKSATLNAMLLQLLAIHRPRLFIIDAGGSFALFGEHCKRLGLTVNQVTLSPEEDVSLPPFADALKALQQEVDGDAELGLEDVDSDPDETEARRDPLGQMEIAARIMITGGEDAELRRLRRPDRLLIRKSLLKAATAVREAGRRQVLTEDVVRALKTLEDLSPPRQARALEMAESLELYCSGVPGHFFNREGRDWPSADITILELGLFAREGYEDALALAYIGLMNHINDRVERRQREARPTIVVNDEAHLISTNPLLAPYTAKVIRLWRKFGAWYWAATHSLEDFPEEARRLLNMMEWWLCLAMDRDAVEQVAHFRELTPEQQALLLAARKEPPKYAEGVVLGAHFNALARIVSPPLALALAMTEQDEKNARAQIRRARGGSELEAVYIMAKQLAEGMR
jgi:conjugative transfer ATPase